jgi:hypothetical protein
MSVQHLNITFLDTFGLLVTVQGAQATNAHIGDDECKHIFLVFLLLRARTLTLRVHIGCFMLHAFSFLFFFSLPCDLS